MSAVPGSPIPAVAITVPVDALPYNQLVGALASQRTGRGGHLPRKVDRLAMDVLARNGAFRTDDRIPREVAVWLAVRLAATDPSSGIHDLVRQSTSALTQEAISSIHPAAIDLGTDIYWFSVLQSIRDRRDHEARAAQATMAPIDATPWCAAVARELPHTGPGALARIATGESIAHATGSSCAPDPGWQTRTLQLTALVHLLITRTHTGEPLDVQALDDINGAMILGRAHLIAPADLRRLSQRLRRAAEGDRLGVDPIGYLLAADATGSQRQPLRLGISGTRFLNGLTGGTDLLPAKPHALRLVALHDLLTLTGDTTISTRISHATTWSLRGLSPTDRIAVAVAAEAADHLDLHQVRRLPLVPASFALARRAQLTSAETCPSSLRTFAGRAIRRVGSAGSASATNPFALSDYAALVALARDCDQHGPGLSIVRHRVDQGLARYLGSDGFARVGPQHQIQPRLTAGLLLAACRTRQRVRRPSTHTATVDLRPFLDPEGGASIAPHGPVDFDASLAVAQIRAIARKGCEGVAA